MNNDPRTFTDPSHLKALRQAVAECRLGGQGDSQELLAALQTLEHYLAWATRLDDLFKHEDMARNVSRSGFIRQPAPGSLKAERLAIVREIEEVQA